MIDKDVQKIYLAMEIKKMMPQISVLSHQSILVNKSDYTHNSKIRYDDD